MPFDDAELVRYLGETFPPDQVPERFAGVPLGTFEYRIDGTWRRGRGSYMRSDGVAMVWVEQ